MATRENESPIDATGPLDLPTVGDAEVLARSRGAMFLVTDRRGDIRPAGAKELGLFSRDTRHLSHWHLVIGRGDVIYLGSDSGGDVFNQVDLMVSDVDDVGFLEDPKNFLHVRRRQILDGDGFVEEITLTNYLTHAMKLSIDLVFGVDFADIFEVRGARRPRRGVPARPRVGKSGVAFAYDGLCGTRYETAVSFGTAPTSLSADRASFSLRFAANEVKTIVAAVAPSNAAARALASSDTGARVAAATEAARERKAACTRIRCDDLLLQSFLDRAASDVHALVVDAGAGRILGAGVPWFCAPFGRDALLTAYQLLSYDPSFAADALRTLAAYQGKRFVHDTEEEPGKIIHELRSGEMTKVGETPHRPYYGSIDATPLFVVLADALHGVLGDVRLLEELAPAVRAALAWIDVRSKEGKAFVRYQRNTERGIENQCWKDSSAGVSGPDGRRAAPPVAVCEVQGYCIDAYVRGARILKTLGDERGATTYARRAERLRATFEERFWLKRKRRYAYAIDGEDRVLDTVVSNVGHLLFSRVVPEERAGAIADLLLSPAMFSGYGIRTLGERQRVYNPLSYHNGTVWPHDNSIIARGLGLYDRKEGAIRIFEGLRHAMEHFRDHRLPELFCGIARSDGPIVRYPVACSPQAWAAGTPFLLLQSVLGIEPDAPNRRLVIRSPRLPSFLRRLEIERLRVGRSWVSMRFRRVGARCHVESLEVEGAPLSTLIEAG